MAASSTKLGPRMQYKSPLLQALLSNLRLRHMSRRTEAAYVYWTRRFVRFAGLRHPADLGIDDVRRFLSHLAVDRKLSASTQQQALSGLLFLYRYVVGRRWKSSRGGSCWSGEGRRARTGSPYCPSRRARGWRTSSGVPSYCTSVMWLGDRDGSSCREG
jgi:hypothetical protein